MDFQSPAGKLAAEHLDQYRQETFDRPPLADPDSEWASLLRRVAPDPGLYFTTEQWADYIRGLPISETAFTYRPTYAAALAQQATVTGYDAYGKPVAETATLPMIDWEKVAGSYAAALAEANSKIRLLEDEVARLTPPATRPERTTSDVLARCIGLDKTLDAYGR